MIIYDTIEQDGRRFSHAQSTLGYLIEDAQGRRYADAAWPYGETRDFTETRIPIDTEDGQPVPRRWTRMTIKGALAEYGIIEAAEQYLSAINVRANYTAWQALNDCDYIEEGYPDATRWNALLDGAAVALGKTRAEIDAFLDSLPTEP